MLVLYDDKDKYTKRSQLMFITICDLLCYIPLICPELAASYLSSTGLAADAL